MKNVQGKKRKMFVKSESDFTAKMVRLQHARESLKSEFAGIDGVIDQFIDTVRPWYIFPDLQERPLVMNLWGMTGTGKTSLVKRFVEMIEWQSYFHCDMGESAELKWSLRNRFSDLHSHRNGLPLIIGFDEFQHARTIRANGAHVNDPSLRLIWELMDSGQFQTSRDNENITYELSGAINALERAMVASVRIINGKLESEPELFKNCIKDQRYDFVHSAFVEADSIKRGSSLFNDHFLDQLLEETKIKFKNRKALDSFIGQCSGIEMLAFLKQVFEDYYRPVNVDCSKALIIVMGNLDEAYPACHNFNPDLSADLFYRESLQIQLPQIKATLKQYFRSEQIARLGHIHIIYPALSVKAYKQIIQQQIDKLKQIYLSKLGVEVHFEQSIERLIYREGVNPSQGTRPLFSCIHNLLQAPMAQIALFIQEKTIQARLIHVEYHNKSILFHFIGADHIINTLKIKPSLRIEILRKERKDNNQALVAVHESGHAVLSMLLLRKIPMQVFSSTVDSEMEGLVSNSPDNSIASKIWVKNQLAVLLGGLCAEKILFGEDAISLGSESDLRMATQLAMKALLKNGFYKYPVCFTPAADESILAVSTLTEELDRECIKWMKEAEAFAFETLKNNMELLLNCSWKLSEKRSIDKKDLRNLFLKFACVDDRQNWFEKISENEKYREILHNQISGAMLSVKSR